MSLTKLKGVGPKTTTQLKNIGINTIEDILFHLPFRYQDRTRIVPINTLRPGDQAVVEGKITAAQVKFVGRRQLQVIIVDSSGSVQLRFFYFNLYSPRLASVPYRKV